MVGEHTLSKRVGQRGAGLLGAPAAPACAVSDAPALASETPESAPELPPASPESLAFSLRTQPEVPCVQAAALSSKATHNARPVTAEKVRCGRRERHALPLKRNDLGSFQAGSENRAPLGQLFEPFFRGANILVSDALVVSERASHDRR
jgi:hypothetical protein